MNEIKREEVATEEEGISLRDVFKSIGKKIWFVLIGALVVALAAVLVFMFAINPVQKSSSMNFEIDYPMSEDGKYPDGSTFNYRDIISRGVVEDAKAKDESFASLDLDKIFEKEGISVSATKQSDDKNAKYTYTVTLKRSYFKGVNAEAFIKALTESFTSFFEAKANSLSYSIDGTTFENASFKDQLRILDEQKAILTAQYDIWIKEYNAGHVVLGKSLGSHRTDVVTTFADDVRTPISTQLSTRGYEYFNCKTTGEDVKNRVVDLQEERILNEAIIVGLKEAMNGGTGSEMKESFSARGSLFAAGDGSETDSSDKNNIIIMPNESDLSSKLAYYSERQAILSQQINNLKVNDKTHETMTLEDYETIAAKIRDYGAETLSKQNREINRRSDILKSVVAAIYKGNTVVIFNSQRLTDNGGTSLAIVGVAVFVAAFAVFAVIAYFVGKNGKKKIDIAENTPDMKDRTEENKANAEEKE